MGSGIGAAAGAGRSGDAVALLDVNPVLAGVRPMTADAEARMTFGIRRAHLD